MTALGVCLLSASVLAQTPEPDPDLKFAIDLRDVIEVYDELNMYPEAVWDTIPPFDYSTIALGPRYRVPHFLKSDFRRTNQIVDNLGINGYRLVCTYPRVYKFDIVETTDGEFITYQPRDVTIPGLEIELVSLDELAERVRVELVAGGMARGCGGFDHLPDSEHCRQTARGFDQRRYPVADAQSARVDLRARRKHPYRHARAARRSLSQGSRGRSMRISAWKVSKSSLFSPLWTWSRSST